MSPFPFPEVPQSHVYLMLSLLNYIVLLGLCWSHYIPGIVWNLLLAILLFVMFRREWNKEVEESLTEI